MVPSIPLRNICSSFPLSPSPLTVFPLCGPNLAPLPVPRQNVLVISSDSMFECLCSIDRSVAGSFKNSHSFLEHLACSFERWPALQGANAGKAKRQRHERAHAENIKNARASMKDGSKNKQNNRCLSQHEKMNKLNRREKGEEEHKAGEARESFSRTSREHTITRAFRLLLSARSSSASCLFEQRASFALFDREH